MIRFPARAVVVMGVVLAACAAPPPRVPTATSTPPVAAGVMEMVLRGWLNSPDAAITLVSAEPQEWPDECLGAPAPGEKCAQVVTPGYKITFEVNDGRYVIHTSDAADSAAFRFRVAAAPAPMIGDGLVTWVGQNALGQGSCAIAAIGAAAIAMNNCTDKMVQANFMRVQNVQALQTYAAEFASFKADTPVGSIAFAGRGSVQPTPAEQRMIAEIASLMAQEASMGRTGASWGNVITFQREGTQSACVNVLTTGEVNVRNCLPNDAGITTRLNALRLAELYRWLDNFTAFEYKVDEPHKITIQFSGRGAKEASEAVMQAVRTFVESLIDEVRGRAQQQNNAGEDPIKTKVLQALNARDYATLQSVMADSFVISYQRSGSLTLSPAKAIDELRTNLLSPDATLAPPSAEASSSIGFMVELESGMKLAGISILKGFGKDGKGEAMLIFVRDSTGREFWHSMIYAMNGFSK